MFISLRKRHRLVQIESHRALFFQAPQVQERLNIQIAERLKSVRRIEDIALIINAGHLCVASRGINHTGCATVTRSFHGRFLEPQKSAVLYAMLTV